MNAKINIEKLPEFCYSVNNVTGKLIRIQNGDSGFYPQNKHPEIKNAELNNESIDELADRLNREMGLNKAIREAMEIGSMWGWEVPGADVDAYNEDGSFKREFLNKK